jgi:hypothetical protein
LDRWSGAKATPTACRQPPTPSAALPDRYRAASAGGGALAGAGTAQPWVEDTRAAAEAQTEQFQAPPGRAYRLGVSAQGGGAALEAPAAVAQRASWRRRSAAAGPIRKAAKERSGGARVVEPPHPQTHKS